MMRTELGQLSARTFDIVIVGGGINGASAAQHLTAAGYSVMLAERNDYASAASSRSTRVLHSGLRYLAPKRSLWEFALRPDRLKGQIRSALESMEAMGQIVTTTPERVRPMDLAVPVYQGAPYAGWHIDVGVKFLRRLSKFGAPLTYARYKGSDTSANPIFKWFRDQDSIKHFVVFRDYQIYWPERFCLDAILEAERMGAQVRNYTEVVALERAPGARWSIRLRDNCAPEQEAVVNAAIVINSAGVWIDDVNRLATQHLAPKRKIIAVKGVHIVVLLPADFRGRGVAAMNRENENIFCIPWGDLHYIGPTETVYQGDLDDVRPEEQDIEFLLKEANHLFPKLILQRKDVLFAWAGARPITYDPEFPKGRRLPFSVLHDQSADGVPNTWSLTWGTINLHRLSARAIVAAVRKRLPPSQNPQPVDYSARLFPENQNSPPVLEDDTAIKLADLRFSAQHEHAVTLVDLLFRRTPLGWRTTMRRADVERAARAVADVLGWQPARIEAEVQRYGDHVRRYHLQELI